MSDVLSGPSTFETPSAEVLSRLAPCAVKESHGKNYRRSPGGTGWICAVCFPTDEPADWQIKPYVRQEKESGPTRHVANAREEMGEIPASADS
jgi:hypothetical protein